LARRLEDTIDEGTLGKILPFVEERFHRLVTEPGFETRVRDFVSGRLDDLAHSGATLAEAVSPESVALLKDRIAQQVAPDRASTRRHCDRRQHTQTDRQPNQAGSRRVLSAPLANQKNLHLT